MDPPIIHTEGTTERRESTLTVNGMDRQEIERRLLSAASRFLPKEKYEAYTCSLAAAYRSSGMSSATGGITPMGGSLS